MTLNLWGKNSVICYHLLSYEIDKINIWIFILVLKTSSSSARAQLMRSNWGAINSISDIEEIGAYVMVKMVIHDHNVVHPYNQF